MIGIDTSALIDLFKGDERIYKLLLKIDEKIVSTQINYLEIVIGIDVENKGFSDEKVFFDNLFDDIKLFDLNISSSKFASKIYWDLKRKGKMIGQLDCAVASIFLSNGVNKIITRNKKHFENISGVKIISY